MLARWREQKGQSLIEYVLILPVVLILTLGAVEVFRLMAIRQSLRAGLAQALPCYTHWRDRTYRGEHDCLDSRGIEAHVRNQLDQNPFARGTNYALTISAAEGRDLEGLYKTAFEVVVEIKVQLGFLTWVARSFTHSVPTATMRESAWTFVDSAPLDLNLNPGTPFPSDPGN